jgi:hypothetical protein
MTKFSRTTVNSLAAAALGGLAFAHGAAALPSDDAQAQARRTLTLPVLTLAPPLLVTARVPSDDPDTDAQTQAAAVLLFRTSTQPRAAQRLLASDRTGPPTVLKAVPDAQEAARLLLTR